MPTTAFKNTVYRTVLPFLAPDVSRTSHWEASGCAAEAPKPYRRILRRSHVMGSDCLLKDGDRQARILQSLSEPRKTAGPDTVYRVASITKMVTALSALKLCAEGALSLDAPVLPLLPDGPNTEVLRDVTLRQLLSHTSGLRDIPSTDQMLKDGRPFHDALAREGIRQSAPGERFSYCNFGFGLIGCLMENQTGRSVEELFQDLVLQPAGMRGTLDGSTLDPDRIMPISRVLPYHADQETVVPPLGRIPLTGPDPLLHYGHTAGSLYTDVLSLSRLLTVILGGNEAFGLPEKLRAEMLTPHAAYGKASPGMSYGLGLVILEDPALSSRRLFGHQGYAYGCADAAFTDEDGRQVIFLNGGCSEARKGRLGVCTWELLRWACRKEIPSWK